MVSRIVVVVEEEEGEGEEEVMVMLVRLLRVVAELYSMLWRGGGERICTLSGEGACG